MENVKVTVLITTYNCGEFILQAIKSVLNQTYQDYELLIVDDGSTDNTENVIKTLNNKKIRYIKLEHVGRSKALNFGLKESKYDWIALMDADDISHPLRLEEQVKHFPLKYNNVILTWSAYFSKNKILYTIETPLVSEIIKKRLSLHSYICNSSVLYNKNFILGNGGYDENTLRFEDYELWLRIKKMVEFLVVPQYYQFVRIRVNSSSNLNKFETRKLVYYIQDNYYKNFYENFLIDNKIEETQIRGWREYFYGDKKNARNEWKRVIYKKVDIRLVLAFLFTYMSTKFLNNIREFRIKLRLLFFIKKVTKTKKIQGDFQELFEKINM